MDFVIKILEASAVTVAVPLFLSWLARRFPYKANKCPKGKMPSFAELQTRYAKWEAGALLPLFISVFGIGYLINLGLFWISRHFVTATANDRFLLLPETAFFWLPALFLGIFGAVVPIDLLYRVLLRERYAEYTYYVNMKHGYDGWDAIKRMASFFIPLCAVFTILGVDCYARFTDDRMITNRFFGLGETIHSYQQITRIKQVQSYKAPNGNIVASPYYVVYFSDGSYWSTFNQLYKVTEDKDSKEQKEAELLIFIADKARKQIEIQKFSDKD